MTREEAADFIDRKILFGAYRENKEYNDALTLAINALRAKPCEDAISRKEVEAIIHNAMFDYAAQDVTYGALAKVRNQINSLPSIKGGYEG